MTNKNAGHYLDMQAVGQKVKMLCSTMHQVTLNYISIAIITLAVFHIVNVASKHT